MQLGWLAGWLCRALRCAAAFPAARAAAPPACAVLIAHSTPALILILQLGADVNALTDYNRPPLIMACEDGSAAGVEALLQAGAQPNVVDSSGVDALIKACSQGHTHLVPPLLVS